MKKINFILSLIVYFFSSDYEDPLQEEFSTKEENKKTEVPYFVIPSGEEKRR